MKKRISLAHTLLLILIAVFLTFQITFTLVTSKYENSIFGLHNWQSLTNKLDYIGSTLPDDNAENGSWKNVYEKLSEIDLIVRSMYISEIDEQYLSDYIMSGYVYGLKDKYAAYLPKEEFDEYLTSIKEGSTVGIGVRIVYDNTIGGIYVSTVIPETPAEEAGLLPGDVIVAVNANAVDTVGYYGAYNIIKDGAAGEPVNLSVATKASDYSEIKEITVVRRKITAVTVTGRIINKNIGYIKIYEFDNNTPEEFKKLYADLTKKGAKKLILDVRDNPGGTLTGVHETLDFILPEGPTVITTDKTGKEVSLTSDKSCIELPMSVLMNQSTASAGELFAAALKDYKIATLIGTTTFGKGSVQTILPLSDGSGIKFSTQMYRPPYSENYDGVGVTPDIESFLSEELLERRYMLTDAEDTQLQCAINELKNK